MPTCSRRMRTQISRPRRISRSRRVPRRCPTRSCWKSSWRSGSPIVRNGGRIRGSRPVILGVLLSLGAGAAQGKRGEAELLQLLELYQGRYTNVAQVEADTNAGREPHAAVELNIVRAYAPRISDYTFY